MKHFTYTLWLHQVDRLVIVEPQPWYVTDKYLQLKKSLVVYCQKNGIKVIHCCICDIFSFFNGMQNKKQLRYVLSWLAPELYPFHQREFVCKYFYYSKMFDAIAASIMSKY